MGFLAICFASSHKSLSSCKTKTSFVCALMSYSLCDNETALIHLYLNDNVLGGKKGRIVGVTFFFLMYSFFFRLTSIGMPGLYQVYVVVQEFRVRCFCEQIGGTYGKGTLLQGPAS